MTATKKMLIATLVFAALFLICGFGLTFLSNVFAVVALYCGLAALFCAIIYLDLREGKRPPLIRLGICMVLLSSIIGYVSDFYRSVSIPLAVAFGLAGVFLIVKGYPNWRKGKNTGITPEKPSDSCAAAPRIKTEYCAGCKKDITGLSGSEVYDIEGAKFCRQCKRKMDQEYERANIVCGVCGAKLAADEIYIVDNVLFCGKCFRKQYGSDDAHEQGVN